MTDSVIVEVVVPQDSPLKAFMVSFYNLFENELYSQVVYARNWREAAIACNETCFLGGEDQLPIIDEVPTSVEEAKHEAFSRDFGFDIKQLSIDVNGIIVSNDPDEIEDDSDGDDDDDDQQA